MNLPDRNGYLALTVGANPLRDWCFSDMPDGALIECALKFGPWHVNGLWIASLTGARTWRLLTRHAVEINPVCIGFRTGHPAVLRLAGRWGALSGHDEGNGQWRFYAGLEETRSFLAHFGRISQKALASAGDTVSR